MRGGGGVEGNSRYVRVCRGVFTTFNSFNDFRHSKTCIAGAGGRLGGDAVGAVFE